MSELTSSTAVRPTHEQISERARALWQERGQPSGQDEEIWFEAERQVADELQSASGTAVPIPPAVATGIASTATALPQAAVPVTDLKSTGAKKRSRAR